MAISREHIRLFTDAPLARGAQIAATREQAHYLRNVMRLCEGGSVGLFNGADGEWRASIIELGKHACRLEAAEQLQPQTTTPDLWLLCAPIKRARFEMIVEKAAELGVREIRPVITEYTSATRVNVERLRLIAIEAAEQCGLVSVPKMHEPEKLHGVLDKWPSERRILFCDEAGAGLPALEGLRQAGAQGAPWAVLTGPEGGFGTAERERLHAMPQAHVVSLGPRILRADTAAIAALSLWQSVYGDWASDPVAMACPPL